MADHLLLPAPSPVGSRRAAGSGGAAQPRNRPAHGQHLRGDLNDAIAAARAVPRRSQGVDPNLVFKVHASRRPTDSGFEGRNLELLGETADYTYFVLSADSGTALAAAIDAYVDNGSLRSLLDLIERIELYGAEDRRGPGLDQLPKTGPVQVDVKIWAADSFAQATTRADVVRAVLRELEGREDLAAIGTRRIILRVTLPAERLPDLLSISVVEQVRTPPVPFLDYRDWWHAEAAQLQRNEVPGPVVGVLDDLPTASHPLLDGLIESVDQIAPATYQWQPPSHHGTEVVGRVLFPRLHEELRDAAPITAHGIVHIARILEPDPGDPGRTRFATWAQPHQLVEDGIRLLHQNYGVKVFNLSIGYDEPYTDAHLGAMTEVIDELIRELDIVVVVPTGNAGIQHPARTSGGHHLAVDYPRYLDHPEHRLAEPGPAALAVTVGSIALSDAIAEMTPPRLGWTAVAGINHVSPFSRTGPGTGPKTERLNKPEFVHYGGNTALNDTGGMVPNEPGSSIVSTALQPATGRLFAACNGTSYAAPAIARVAADIAHAYPEASANLIRVLLAIGAKPVQEPSAGQSQHRHRAHYGYGLPTAERSISSGRRRATMTFDGSLSVDTVHIHPVPIPAAFRRGSGHKRTLTVTLAYDPPVRHTRREYLASSMQVDLYRQIPLPELRAMLEHQDPDNPATLIHGARHPGLLPGVDFFRSSTLQMRAWTRKNTFIDDDEIFYVAVTHRSTTWARDDNNYTEQNYALAVTLEDEHLQQADLLQLLQQETRLPARVRLRS